MRSGLNGRDQAPQGLPSSVPPQNRTGFCYFARPHHQQNPVRRSVRLVDITDERRRGIPLVEGPPWADALLRHGFIKTLEKAGLDPAVAPIQAFELGELFLPKSFLAVFFFWQF